MFSTPCDGCAFLNNKKCGADQHCIELNDRVIAPGFCRLFTSDEDYDKTLPVLNNIIKAREKASLKYDLVILFDDTIHTIADILKTEYQFCTDHYLKNVRILDYNRTRSRMSIQYFQKKARPTNKPAFTTMMEAKCDIVEEAIDHIIKLCTSPYVLVVNAGQSVGSLHLLSSIVESDNRCVFWQFPIQRQSTLFFESDNPLGLYIRQAYKQIGGTHKDQDGHVHKYIDKLRNIDKSYGINLIWFSEAISIVT